MNTYSVTLTQTIEANNEEQAEQLAKELAYMADVEVDLMQENIDE